MPEPAAGWYPDGVGGTRWWDGAAWTDHVQPQPEAAAEATPEPAKDGRIGAVALTVIGVVTIVAVVLGVVLFNRSAGVSANCGSLASMATGINQPPLTAPSLRQLTDPVVLEDHRSTYKKPTGTQEPVLVYSCRGLGSYADGTQAATVVRLSYSATGTYVVSYGAA